LLQAERLLDALGESLVL
jgi:hypothetical protein